MFMPEEKKITSIGGQAVIEGVMMRGPFKTAVAVRKPDGNIECKIDENGTKKHNWFLRLPIIRGCVNFIESLVIGMKALMFSAEFVDIEGEEEQESKFDKWLEDKLGDKIKDIVIYVAVAISVVFSVGLFILLPTAITQGVQFIFEKIGMEKVSKTGTFISLCEGIIKMIIFLTYMYLISKMNDIKRVFEYHGAEHKTIACYEAGEELTCENVKKFTRFHPRCGTSFLLFVMIVSIILYALLPKFSGEGYSALQRLFFRMGTRLALLPLVAGISYEIIKFAGRSKNACVKWLTKPGLWLQRLTTREPDESQIETAIASLLAVIPDIEGADKW
ncbi:MAG TPA: DUF1385 domain-containing protein [Clostridiales bacterium]|nr:DUF1385 domain-containing protein [Clostridiales bacterium]